MSGKAVVWDAYKKYQLEGVFIKRFPDGIAIDLPSGIRYFAKNDKIISVEEPEEEH